MNQTKVCGNLRDGGTEYAPGHLYWLDVERKSGAVDTLMVLSPGEKLPEGQVQVTGRICSEYIHGVGVPVFIVPASVEPGGDGGSSEACVHGTLKKDPVLRKTSKGTDISSVLLMTEDGPVPTVLWGGPARKVVKTLKKGSPLHVNGRLQSRTFPLRRGGTRTTWELSVGSLIE